MIFFFFFALCHCDVGYLKIVRKYNTIYLFHLMLETKILSFIFVFFFLDRRIILCFWHHGFDFFVWPKMYGVDLQINIHTTKEWRKKNQLNASGTCTKIVLHRSGITKFALIRILKPKTINHLRYMRIVSIMMIIIIIVLNSINSFDYTEPSTCCVYICHTIETLHRNIRSAVYLHAYFDSQCPNIEISAQNCFTVNTKQCYVY